MRVENNNVSGQNHDPEQIDLIDLLGDAANLLI